MDDDNTKEENQPSTSKKESQRVNSGHDMYDERGRDDQATNSESSASATYSVRSRLEMAEARPEMPKPSLATNREQTPPERKKRGRRATGRVEKRRRSGTRRQMRRAPKRRARPKDARKGRSLSVSTIFTRLSTSGSRTPGCIHCGHRCCRRRYEHQLRMARIARMEKRQTRKQRKIKKRRRRRVVNRRAKAPIIPYAAMISGRLSPGLEAIQIGSRSMMLSPLFINTAPPGPEIDLEPMLHIEVTPEMIYESLRRLTMWRQNVATTSILDYLKKNYPVNNDEIELYEELREKLRVAAIVGIVKSLDEDHWGLSCLLQKRKLTKTHVTRFWKIYGDTMRPVTKKITEQKDKADRTDDETNTNKKHTNIVFRLDSI